MRYGPLCLGISLSYVAIFVRGSHFLHKLFHPKRIERRIIPEDDYEEYDSSPYYQQIRPVYYLVPQPLQFNQLPPQQPSFYPFGPQQPQMAGQMPYSGMPPKEVEHRMYSTKIVDECPPQHSFPQQPPNYYFQPTQQQGPQIQMPPIPPINLYLENERRPQPSISGQSYSINVPPSPSMNFESGFESREEKERKFHQYGKDALHNMEKMFDEMGRTASPLEREQYSKRRDEILRQFRTMFGEFDNQYDKALKARGG
jgi:hypothetical protein